MHERLVRLRTGADVRGRLQRPDLVVGQLHAHEDRLGADRGLHLGRVVTAETVDADDRVLHTPAFDRVPHRRVLHRSGDDVAATAGACDRAEHRGVHRLRAGRGEHDFPRPSAQERGDLFARVFQSDTRHSALCVQPTGVARMLTKIGEHRFEHRWTEWCRRRVVEIRASHDEFTRA
jgi:hypothetical protein